jgi:hypothetical protein
VLLPLFFSSSFSVLQLFFLFGLLVFLWMKGSCSTEIITCAKHHYHQSSKRQRSARGTTSVVEKEEGQQQDKGGEGSLCGSCWQHDISREEKTKTKKQQHVFAGVDDVAEGEGGGEGRGASDNEHQERAPTIIGV